MHPHPRVVGLIVACVALVATACAPASDSGGERKAATNATIPTFVYGLEAIPGTLDVSDDYNSADMAVMGLITQPLEIPNLDGTFTPVLATTVSQPDQLTLVYDLREDVTFSDGSPLTADDVVWTIAHLREPDTQTATELSDFDTVTATGPHQVTVTLKKPNNAARGAFAIISFIQQQAYGEKSGAQLGSPEAPPVGTGPYVVDTFDANGITLTRNTAFADPPPAVDKVEFTPISDDNSAQLAMRSGELDAFPLLDIKSAGTWKGVQGVSVFSSATLYLDYITMDTTTAPFDDIHVRRAVSYATDAAGLRQANYGSEAQAPTALTPTQIIDKMAPDPAAVDAIEAPFAANTYDMDKAKQELALSQHPDGFTADYVYYSPPGKIVGISLAENLKKLGITLNLRFQRINDLLGDLFVGKAPATGFFSIAAVVPDPASWYLYLAGKDNPYNTARYSTDVTEKALDTIATSADEGARWDAMTTITAAMATDLPYVQLSQPNFAFALAEGATFTQEPDFIDVTSGTWINYLKSTS